MIIFKKMHKINELCQMLFTKSLAWLVMCFRLCERACDGCGQEISHFGEGSCFAVNSMSQMTMKICDLSKLSSHRRCAI